MPDCPDWWHTVPVFPATCPEHLKCIFDHSMWNLHSRTCQRNRSSCMESRTLIKFATKVILHDSRRNQHPHPIYALKYNRSERISWTRHDPPQCQNASRKSLYCNQLLAAKIRGCRNYFRPNSEQSTQLENLIQCKMVSTKQSVWKHVISGIFLLQSLKFPLYALYLKSSPKNDWLSHKKEKKKKPTSILNWKHAEEWKMLVWFNINIPKGNNVRSHLSLGKFAVTLKSQTLSLASYQLLHSVSPKWRSCISPRDTFLNDLFFPLRTDPQPLFNKDYL